MFKSSLFLILLCGVVLCGVCWYHHIIPNQTILPDRIHRSLTTEYTYSKSDYVYIRPGKNTKNEKEKKQDERIMNDENPNIKPKLNPNQTPKNQKKILPPATTSNSKTASQITVKTKPQQPQETAKAKQPPPPASRTSPPLKDSIYTDETKSGEVVSYYTKYQKIYYWLDLLCV